MKMLCLNCEAIHEVTVKNEYREYEIKKITVVGKITAYICSYCGNEIYNKDTEVCNDIIFFDEYKKKLNLLTSKEIISIRNSYNLSQATFSKILGFGLKTITRYENGAIQDSTHDNLIRLSAIKANLKLLWDNNKYKLTDYENLNISQSVLNK